MARSLIRRCSGLAGWVVSCTSHVATYRAARAGLPVDETKGIECLIEYPYDPLPGQRGQSRGSKIGTHWR